MAWDKKEEVSAVPGCPQCGQRPLIAKSETDGNWYIGCPLAWSGETMDDNLRHPLFGMCRSADHAKAFWCQHVAYAYVYTNQWLRFDSRILKYEHKKMKTYLQQMAAGDDKDAKAILDDLSDWIKEEIEEEIDAG